MRKHLAAFICLLLPIVCAAQSGTWAPATSAPYFRHINAVQVLSSGRIIAVGGNPTNDAITSIFYSSDSAATWYIAKDLINAMMNDVHFPTSNTGYAVGNSGKIFKTTDAGINWDPLTLTGSAANRHFNGVHFINATTGIAVGGNRTNDAIQTIIRTTDGGLNWSVITDNQSSWLLDVMFVDATTGYAVGEQGKVLKTTDAGLSWSVVNVPANIGSRQLHAVHFFNPQAGVVVGGNPSNDSIQTIITTTDGGQSWNIVRNNIASMLKTVHFISATEGYAAGNDGVMLHTTNQGQSWSDVTIAGNNNFAINDIHFLNPAFGTAGGRFGKALIFQDASVSMPTATISTPVGIVNSNTAQINGLVSANGGTATIEFEYGNSPAFGSTAVMSPSSTTANQQAVSLILSGLQPGSLYFGRIKATTASGTAYSSTVQFSTNLSTIPNFNFEIWNSFSTESLVNWGTAGQVQKVSSFNGSFAAKAQAVSTQEPGAILYANVGGAGIQPLPYNGRPDSLTFYAKYDIAAGDSALVVLSLMSNGSPVSDNMFKISGSSSGQFVQLRFPVAYSSAATPDSMALLFISTNFFSGTVFTQSELTIDNVVLTGTTVQLPNSNMEQWTISTRNSAASWWSQDDMNYQPGDSTIVSRTTDAYSGNYALLLRNNPATGQFAYLSTGQGFGMPSPDFPVQHRHNTFNGYYKFNSDNGDTLFISVTLFNQGMQIGYVYHPVTQSVNQFTLFSLPVTYFGSAVPDSAHISFSIRKNNGTTNPGNSWAIIDNLSFDGVALPLSVEEAPAMENLRVKLYPNPASHQVNVDLKGISDGAGLVELAVYDLTGRLQLKQSVAGGQDSARLEVHNLSPQLYILVINTGNKFFTTKFVKSL